MGQHNSKRGNADVFAWPKAEGGGRSGGSSGSSTAAHAHSVAAAADSAERDAVTRRYRACLLAAERGEGTRGDADAGAEAAGDADDDVAAAVVAAAVATQPGAGDASQPFAATFPTLASFACYWAVPPPVVLADSDGAREMWRRQCLGVAWHPSEKTAPGLSALRWYVPPPPLPRSGEGGSDEAAHGWDKIFCTGSHGFSLGKLHEAGGLYPGPTVLCLRLKLGTLGVVLDAGGWPASFSGSRSSPWPQDSVLRIFFAVGRRLRVEEARANGKGSAAVDEKRGVVVFGDVCVDLDLQGCRVGSPDLHEVGAHEVHSVELWGVGSDAHRKAYERRADGRRAAEESARSVNRAHMAEGGAGADRFVLQAAGIVGERYDGDYNHVDPDGDGTW